MGTWLNLLSSYLGGWSISSEESILWLPHKAMGQRTLSQGHQGSTQRAGTSTYQTENVVQASWLEQAHEDMRSTLYGVAIWPPFTIFWKCKQVLTVKLSKRRFSPWKRSLQVRAWRSEILRGSPSGWCLSILSGRCSVQIACQVNQWKCAAVHHWPAIDKGQRGSHARRLDVSEVYLGVWRGSLCCLHNQNVRHNKDNKLSYRPKNDWQASCLTLAIWLLFWAHMLRQPSLLIFILAS